MSVVFMCWQKRISVILRTISKIQSHLIIYFFAARGFNKMIVFNVSHILNNLMSISINLFNNKCTLFEGACVDHRKSDTVTKLNLRVK